MPADGHTHFGTSRGCTDETLHQFALLKKRRENLADSNVRRFSDCAQHDKTRDMAGVECYPVPPNSQKKR